MCADLLVLMQSLLHVNVCVRALGLATALCCQSGRSLEWRISQHRKGVWNAVELQLRSGHRAYVSRHSYLATGMKTRPNWKEPSIVPDVLIIQRCVKM